MNAIQPFSAKVKDVAVTAALVYCNEDVIPLVNIINSDCCQYTDQGTARLPRNWSSIPWRGKRYFSLSQHSDWLCGSPSPLYHKQQGALSLE